MMEIVVSYEIVPKLFSYVLGDRFRSAIDDAWWCGKIINRNKNAQSPFLCYKIRWDNGEDENLSPWDLEPLNSRRMYPLLRVRN